MSATMARRRQKREKAKKAKLAEERTQIENVLAGEPETAPQQRSNRKGNGSNSNRKI